MTGVREELRALARVQFGKDAGQALLADPMRLHGRPWFQRISDGSGVDLATWREERGLFQLTVAGGVRLGAAASSTIEIAPGVELQGDLFSPGVVRAGEDIREGDAVILQREGVVLAVGEAAMPGPAMKNLGRGMVARVRHHRPDIEGTRSSRPTTALPELGRSSSG